MDGKRIVVAAAAAAECNGFFFNFYFSAYAKYSINVVVSVWTGSKLASVGINAKYARARK